MWKILSQETKFNTKWFSVRQDSCLLPGGLIVEDYFVIERNDFVVIFAITEDQQVIFVRQYRHAVGESMLEVPGGDCEPGEIPSQTAKRELIEETGYDSNYFQEVATLTVDPTRQNNRVHIFIALQARPIAVQDRTQELQELEVELVSWRDVISTIELGKLSSLDSVAAVYIAYHFLNHG